MATDIQKKRAITKRLYNAISEAIRKEIEIARKKAEEEARRKKIEADKKAAELAAAKAAANNPNVYGTGAGKVILAGGAKYDLPKDPDPSTTKSNNNATSTASNTKPNKPYNPVAATVNNSTNESNKNKSNYTPSSTPEVALLSKGFEENRGKLPWPVSSGVIVDQFGKHKHAIATRVEIDNNGIDIQTGQGAKARAAFDGNVTNVLSMAGAGQTIIINHGKYFTVYSGLSNVSVKKGDNVSTKQVIGTVGNNEDGVAILNFQVWRGAEKMNPAGWIAPM